MFQLKNVKIHHGLSEETYCYTASLYLNGKKVADCSNHGTGGPDDYHWVSPEAKEEVLAITRALHPEASQYSVSVEFVVGDLLNKYEENRKLQRLMKKETLFRIPGETYEEGEYNRVKVKFDGVVKNVLVSKYGPQVFILNEKGV